MSSYYDDHAYRRHPLSLRSTLPASRPFWVAVLVVAVAVILASSKRKAPVKQPAVAPVKPVVITEKQEHEQEADVLRRVKIDHERNKGSRALVEASQDYVQ